jgi:hypothetical protein
MTNIAALQLQTDLQRALAERRAALPPETQPKPLYPAPKEVQQ